MTFPWTTISISVFLHYTFNSQYSRLILFS